MTIRFAPIVFPVLMAALAPALAAAEERYFPDGVWGPPIGADAAASQAEQDRGYENSFGGRLHEEHERPLWVERAAAHAALSIRMSTFRGAVYPDFWLIRLAVKPNGRITYYLRKHVITSMDDTSGPARLPGQKLIEEKGSVDPEHAAAINALIAEIAPLTSKTPSQIDDGGGFDGDTTLFEFSDEGKFNAIKRWELDSKTGGALGRLQALLQEIAFDLPRKNQHQGHRSR